MAEAVTHDTVIVWRSFSLPCSSHNQKSASIYATTRPPKKILCELGMYAYGYSIYQYDKSA